MRANRGPLWLAIALLVSGCATQIADSAPTHTSHMDFSRIPDAVPRVEPPSSRGNPDRYEIDGKVYHVLASSKGYVERGIASWYGTKFHGRLTSNGEVYDMFKMTAAHRTLPLPTYARVTNLQNGLSVVVRINDRGPFHANRLIDLSYAAARKLQLANHGTALVEVRALDPAEDGPRIRLANGLAAGDSGIPHGDGTTQTVKSPVSISVQTTPATLVAAAPQPVRPLLAAAVKMESLAGNETPQGNQTDRQLPNLYYLQVGAFADRNNAERERERLAHTVSRVTVDATPTPERLYRVRIGPFPTREAAAALIDKVADLGVTAPRVVDR